MTRPAPAVIVAVVLAGSAILTGIGGPVDAQSVGVTNDVEDFERLSDGQVVVLERVGVNRRAEGDLAIVHVYDGWGERTSRHPIDDTTVPANSSANLVGLVRAGGGGWWLVAANGTAYRFTADWAYADETRTLSRPDGWPDVGTSPYRDGPVEWVGAAERGPDGGIWVAGRHGLLVYEPGFGGVRSAYRATHDGDDGYRVAGLEVNREAVWLLGYDGLRRYDLDGDGRLADQQVDDVDGFHDAMEFRTDVEPAPDGDWLVVDGGGTVRRVTGSLVHTGIGYEVGSGAAYPGTPGDIVTFAPPFSLVVAALGALVLLALLAAVLARGWRRDLDPRGYAVGVAVCALWLPAVYTWPWPLRPLLFTLPFPEAVVPLATLLIVAGHLGALRQEGLEERNVRTTAVAYAPLLVAAIVLFGELVL